MNKLQKRLFKIWIYLAGYLVLFSASLNMTDTVFCKSVDLEDLIRDGLVYWVLFLVTGVFSYLVWTRMTLDK